MSAVISIYNGKLAIFASEHEFAGEVIQEYVAFTNESDAIRAAKDLLIRRGLDSNPVISKPRNQPQ